MNHSCQSNARHRNLLWKSTSLTGSHSNAQGVLSNAFFLWRLSEHHYSPCGPLGVSHNALWTAYHMVARQSKNIVHGIACVTCWCASIIQVIHSSTSQGRAKWTSLWQRNRRSRQRAQLRKTQLQKKQTFCQNWPTRVKKKKWGSIRIEKWIMSMIINILVDGIIILNQWSNYRTANKSQEKKNPF